eukprot:m51a1_g8825 putative solute carrier family 35 member f6 (763) ;mRNA; f:362450-368662
MSGGLTLKKGLLEVGMLTTGVICTLFVKAQDNSRAKGWGGEEHAFEHPWTQSLFMFWAESTCLVAFLISQCVAKRRMQKSGVREAKPKTFLEKYPPILALPACCDMFATSISSIGLLYCNASVWQMLRGSCIVFVTILGRIFFKRKPPMYRILALAISVCGLILVGLSNVLSSIDEDDGDAAGSGSGSSGAKGDGGSKTTAWGTIVGVVLVLFSQLINACQVTIEETLLKKRNLAPQQVVGMEGIFGTMIISLVVLPIVYCIPGSSPSSMKRNSYDNAIDAFMMLGNNRALLGFVLGYICCNGLFNFFAQSVTKYLTGSHYALIDACRSIFVWAWQLMTFYCISEQYGEKWTKYSGLQVAGFVLLSVGTALFNGIPRLPGFSYEEEQPKDIETAGTESTLTVDVSMDRKHEAELGSVPDTLAPLYVRSGDGERQMLWQTGDAFPTQDDVVNTVVRAVAAADAVHQGFSEMTRTDAMTVYVTQSEELGNHSAEGVWVSNRTLSSTALWRKYVGLVWRSEGFSDTPTLRVITRAFGDIFALTLDTIENPSATRPRSAGQCSGPGLSKRWVMAHECSDPARCYAPNRSAGDAGVRDAWAPGCLKMRSSELPGIGEDLPYPATAAQMIPPPFESQALYAQFRPGLSKRWVMAYECSDPARCYAPNRSAGDAGVRDAWAPGCLKMRSSELPGIGEDLPYPATAAQMIPPPFESQALYAQFNSLPITHTFAILADGDEESGVRGIGVDAAYALFWNALIRLRPPVMVF